MSGHSQLAVGTAELWTFETLAQLTLPALLRHFRIPIMLNAHCMRVDVNMPVSTEFKTIGGQAPDLRREDKQCGLA